MSCAQIKRCANAPAKPDVQVARSKVPSRPRASEQIEEITPGDWLWTRFRTSGVFERLGWPMLSCARRAASVYARARCARWRHSKCARAMNELPSREDSGVRSSRELSVRSSRELEGGGQATGGMRVERAAEG
eukprot:6212898-Pleurochrysis_carterae.AAC.11